MQKFIQKFRQSSVVFEKPGILPEKLKTLTSSNYHSVLSICFAENSHTFPTYQCLQKGVRDFFLVYLDLELFSKIKKTWFIHTRF